MSKPVWMYDWVEGESPEGHGDIQCVPGGRVWISHPDHDSDFDTHEERWSVRDMENRARKLVVAVPQLVRALLAVEWGGPFVDSSPQNFAPIGNVVRKTVACSGCGGNHLDGHTTGCPLDAALTAAGFPDQASRDGARRMLATGCTCGEDANMDPDKSLPHMPKCPRARD